LQLAENLNDDGLVREARRSLGSVLLLAGRSPEALEQLEKSAALFGQNSDQRSRIFFSFDSKVIVEAFTGLALLQLGYPDKSAEKLSAGFTLARDLGHPETLVVAGHVAAQIHQQCGDAHLARLFAKNALGLAEEYGFSLWVTFGLVELGWAEAELGDAEGGIEKMRRGLAQYELTGAKLRCPYFLGLLADQLRKAGRLDEAFELITKGIDLAEQTGEGYALSELHLIKGDIFLNSSKLIKGGKFLGDSSEPSDQMLARASFAEASAIAKQQGTRFWELKAAVSLYRLDLVLGNASHTQLAGIYSSFTEGFETVDLKQARALLEVAARAASS
jgi:tetratricopeptide (TPR) repeat protein